MGGMLSGNSSLRTFYFVRNITSNFSSVLGTGTARNRNCPACKSPRRFGADPAGLRRFSEILSGANHFRKGASQLFLIVGSITVPAALHIPPKEVCSTKPAIQHHVRTK